MKWYNFKKKLPKPGQSIIIVDFHIDFGFKYHAGEMSRHGDVVTMTDDGGDINMTIDAIKKGYSLYLWTEIVEPDWVKFEVKNDS